VVDGSGRDLTVVLVHGAFANPSVWSFVVRQLRDEGIPVATATNPLRSLHGDADSVARLARNIGGRVVLAGHGYGGAVISSAATQVPQAVGLVFIAGYALAAGECVLDVVRQFPSPELVTALGHADDLRLDRSAFASAYAADVPVDTAAILAANQSSMARDCVTQPARVAAWTRLRSWYLVATDDRCVAPRAQRAMAVRAGSHILETAGSHAVVISQPTAVVDMLVTAISVLR
jgi:pimeloyl-ACP methyl ester carboxylesterase